MPKTLIISGFLICLALSHLHSNSKHLTSDRCGFNSERETKFLRLKTEDEEIVNRLQKVPVDIWHPIDISKVALLTPEIDTSELDKLSSPEKVDFVKNFVIPEAVSILKQVIQVRSNQVIPPFDPSLCRDYDDEDGRPNIAIRSNYHLKGLQADHLLYVGVVNKPHKNYLAYASFCMLGKLCPG